MARGTIFKRCKGCGRKVEGRRCEPCDRRDYTWAYAVRDEVASKAEGRRVQRMRSGFSTKAEAEDDLRTFLGEQEDGTYVRPNNLTLGHYLSDWLEAQRGKVRAGTWESKRLHVERYVLPYKVAGIPIQALLPEHLEAFYRELQERGRIRGDEPLSPATVHKTHALIRQALGHAVKRRLISHNVAEGLHKLPSDARPEVDAWDERELGRFLTHVADDDLFAFWRLAAYSGMRRGELLGLRWRDVDFDRGRVTVRRSRVKGAGGDPIVTKPKTKRSERTIDLDPTTVQVLREHKHGQRVVRLDGGDDGGALVFARPDGQPLHPDGVSSRFKRHVKAAGVREIRLHDLRHTHATLLLAAGIPLHVVSARLGHASEAFTAQVYAHVLPRQDAEAAVRFAELVDGQAG